ncbi:MAG: phosphotransferase family protein [Myxococcales bacterium]|nr:phosphotransferase family protein [Myxococcales bacterium]
MEAEKAETLRPGWIDRPRTMRAGEELDKARLEEWLRARIPDLATPITVEQFPSGHSNLTYSIRGGERDLVLRRPPFGSKVKSAHDMGREYRVLSHLAPIYPPAPRPLLHCDDESVIGAPFYVMERVRGIILRRVLPPGFTMGPDLARGLSESFLDNLATLHAIDYRAAGLGDLGRPEGYVERQVAGWTKRYHDARTDDLAAIDAIARWLAERMARPSEAALIHNDYKYDNLILDPADPTKILALLDWEMSTVGDPLMDLGTALSYWIEAGDPAELMVFAFGPTFVPGSLTRRQLADRYGARTGRDVSDMLFYYCFALFKNAVVAQQIYYRYVQGLTRDDRFAGFGAAVKILATVAVQAAESGSI